MYRYSNSVSTYMNITYMHHATPSGHRFLVFFSGAPRKSPPCVWEKKSRCRRDQPDSKMIIGLGCESWGSGWWSPGKPQWIGLFGKILTGNPWVFTINYRSFRLTFSHHPILWKPSGFKSWPYETMRKTRFEHIWLVVYQPTPLKNMKVSWEYHSQ